MGQVGAHHEQLHGTEQQRQCATDQHPQAGLLPGDGLRQPEPSGQRSPTSQQQGHLGRAEVAAHEIHIPAQGPVARVAMEIGIAGRGGALVVQGVIAPATPIAQSAIQSQGQGAQLVVRPGPARQQQTVHGVVGHDEQARVQQGAEQDRSQANGSGQGGQVQRQHAPQGCEPEEEDQGRQCQTLISGQPQRWNFSSSAGDASRSIATK